MEVSSDLKSWKDELSSLVEDSGIRVTRDSVGVARSTPAKGVESEDKESLKDQINGFVKACGEMVVELGRGFRDVVEQTVLTEDSYIMKRTRGPLNQISERLRFLNEFLPEDRDPFHVWAVILFVSVLALSVLTVNNKHESSSLIVKKISVHPPSASRILLPDGRYLAYHQTGVLDNKARFSIIKPHSFLSSRLAGIPGVKGSLLEEFGIRLISYDLPGFGESDPHTERNLNSSALDMLHLADSVGITGKFWVLGYSSGSLHAWAALKYIPHRLSGAAIVAPWVNPYERSMTKEETSRIWENWTQRRKLLYYFARRIPKLLPFFYRRTFLSGNHGKIDKWLSLSLGKKDRNVVETEAFEQIWHRDVEESIRQGETRPFVEEAVLRVSDWGFSLADLQVQKKCSRYGIRNWLQFMYGGEQECELTGFLGPIHVWQGMNDTVNPRSMTDYVARVLPSASVHRLEEEGHFSFFFLCDECHRMMLTTLFGAPKGPISISEEPQTEEGI